MVAFCMVAATSYEMRYSTNVEELKGNFRNSRTVTIGNIVRGAGTLTAPKPSGNRETMEAILFDVTLNQTIYVGIKVTDKSNKQSDLSNVVKLRFVVPSTTTTPWPTTTTLKPTKPPSNRNLVIILPITLFIIALLVAIIILGVKLRKRKPRPPIFENIDMGELVDESPKIVVDPVNPPIMRDGWRLPGLAND